MFNYFKSSKSSYLTKSSRSSIISRLSHPIKSPISHLSNWLSKKLLWNLNYDESIKSSKSSKSSNEINELAKFDINSINYTISHLGESINNVYITDENNDIIPDYFELIYYYIIKKNVQIKIFSPHKLITLEIIHKEKNISFKILLNESIKTDTQVMYYGKKLPIYIYSIPSKNNKYNNNDNQ